jgi:peptide deformylase|tara:strand:+ start:993 stop:1538 length:546 start_codon:yes stop_codon:yes gene_type:complete
MRNTLIKHDHELLHQVCKPASRWGGRRIAKLLLKEIKKNKPIAIGMSANQIGIPYRVAVVQVKGDPIILINPMIIVKENPIKATSEGCLSYPGQELKVPRYGRIVVESKLGRIESGGNNTSWSEHLETIAIQHEIDHLNGITIMDSGLKPVTVDTRTGRNEPCPCGSERKYKQCCLAQKGA